jgi:Ca2+-binding EF-hand superfamily protein
VGRMREAGVGGSRMDIDMLFDGFDRDKDGIISFREFYSRNNGYNSGNNYFSSVY